MLQLAARGDPLGRHDVRPLSAVIAECGGPALRARYRPVP